MKTIKLILLSSLKCFNKFLHNSADLLIYFKFSIKFTKYMLNAYHFQGAKLSASGDKKKKKRMKDSIWSQGIYSFIRTIDI